MDQNIDAPLRLASIHVQGTPHTRRSFLDSLVRPYIKPEAQTLGSILHDARAIGALLNDLDVYDSVVARVERSREPLAQHDDVELIFKMREKSRMFLKTATEIGNNEGGAVRGHSTSFNLGLITHAIRRAQHAEFATRLEEQKRSRLTSPSGQQRVSRSMRLCRLPFRLSPAA